MMDQFQDDQATSAWPGQPDPGAPPPWPGGPPPYTGPPQPPRKTHRVRKVVLLCLAGFVSFIVVIAVVAGLTSGSPVKKAASPQRSASASPAATTFTDPNGMACASADSAGYCPGDDPAPPTPTVNPATKVTFVVTGWGNPSITYGSDSDNRDGGGTLGQLGDGNGLPWKRTMTFSGDVLYYSIDAQLEGAGDISCKIVVSGPGDAPLTVSRGHASGGYNTCSAQAAPSDSTGTSWQDEG